MQIQGTGEIGSTYREGTVLQIRREPIARREGVYDLSEGIMT